MPSKYPSCDSKLGESSNPSTTSVTRRTVLLSVSTGRELASIGWIGLQPVDIVIGAERLGGVKELFGCMGALTSPKVFGVSTRFDTEYYWLASSDSLTLLDYDANKVKGQLFRSSVRVGSHVVPLSPLLPGTYDYLEFEPHPLASDEELIVTFILMEILRRSRFANTHASSGSGSMSKTWFVRSAGERLSRVGKNLTLRRQTI